MGGDYTSVLNDGVRIAKLEKDLTSSITNTETYPGSRAFNALSDNHGAMAFHLAASSLIASLDHLGTVADIVSSGRIPTYALMSLLRTGHECALVAEWLMDPTIDDNTRVSRGVGAQVADYEERRKLEDTLKAPEPGRGKLARHRIDDLLQEALPRGYAKPNKKGAIVPSDPLPGAVALFDMYEGDSGSFLYRYASGFAHGKQWALVQGAEPTRPMDAYGHSVGRVTASDQHTVALSALATDAAERSVSAYLRHHEEPT